MIPTSENQKTSRTGNNWVGQVSAETTYLPFHSDNNSPSADKREATHSNHAHLAKTTRSFRSNLITCYAHAPQPVV